MKSRASRPSAIAVRLLVAVCLAALVASLAPMAAASVNAALAHAFTGDDSLRFSRSSGGAASATTPTASVRADAMQGERRSGGGSRSSAYAIALRPAPKAVPEGATSKILLRDPRQLQSKFKHASDFGVTGNYSRANAVRFSEAIHRHINDSGVRAIQGAYRKQPVTHHIDPASGLNVMSDPAGNLISGWRLSQAQRRNVLKHGGL